VPRGGTPQVSLAYDAARLFQKTFPMQIPKLSHFFPSLSTGILAKSARFQTVWRSSMPLVGSNTYLQGTYEEAATDEFLLDHPVQGLASLEEKSGAD